MTADDVSNAPSARRPPPPASLSVVIPTWNEAPLIGDAVENAREIGDEVIVVDADSPDGTADVARAAGAEVVLAPKGRGMQLRAGADRARGPRAPMEHAERVQIGVSVVR
jgi:glycosyltransferase involved in cell wall biosynthesis